MRRLGSAVSNLFSPGGEASLDLRRDEFWRRDLRRTDGTDVGKILLQRRDRLGSELSRRLKCLGLAPAAPCSQCSTPL